MGKKERASTPTEASKKRQPVPRPMPALTPLESCAAVSTLLLLSSTYIIIPAIVTLQSYRLYVTSFKDAFSWTVLALLGGLAVVPTAVVPSLRRTWLLKTVAKYFDFRWIDESGVGLADLNDKNNDKRFMAVWFPHGIIPLGGFLAASQFDDRMPGYFGRMAVAPALLHVPFLRSVFGAFGSMPNDKKSMVRALETEKHLALFPGGIAELFFSSRSEEKLYLKERKGFVKVALQTGTNIVPVYVFGHTHMFDQLSNVPTVAAISRFFRASVTLFWGRCFLPLPYRTPVTFIRGKPIEIKERVPNPTPEQIEEVHAQVVGAVKRIFENFKHEAGEEYAKKELVIV